MARTVRNATPADAAACAEVYAPYVTGTAVTFESQPPTAAEMARRIAEAHAWLVLEDDGELVGYAYGGAFRARPAYRWSCEVTVYLRQGVRRTGAGRALYAALLARMVERGFHTAVAGITLPNEASVGLHRAMGFETVGTYREIGGKDGAWHDVLWLQRRLSDDRVPGPPPR